MLNEYVAVIQAGGKGTRLEKLTKNKIPKPLVEINGLPMLEWQLINLKENGVINFIFIIGHLGEKIKEYFSDGNRWNVSIKYIDETSPLGSAGALYYLKNSDISKDFLLIFGDVMFDIDFDKMIHFHKNKGALATLLVHPNSHPYDSDLVLLDKDDCVIGFDSKMNQRQYWYKNCVNSGIYVLSAELLNKIDSLNKMDLEKDIIVPCLPENRIFGYRTSEYVKDAGTVERFQSVCEEQREGVWSRKNLRNKQKCIFLDRDGTINKYVGLVSDEEQFELENGVEEAVRKINQSGYLAIVVTNQPVVARGLCQVEDVENIHKKMEVLLGKKGAYLDDCIWCPHHPDKGFPEENPLYKTDCSCRKPATGMIDKMAEKYNIDLSRSYMIGDTTTDVQTGINANMHTVLIKTGQAGADGKYLVKAELEADNLMEAVDTILSIEHGL